MSGRVQGVGYRDFLREAAKQSGVSGWVRNRTDGSVEALLQGPAAAVDRVLEQARTGPLAAQVVEIRSTPPEPQFERVYEGFERWPTA